MKAKELKELKDGTLLYNGHTEGIIKTVDGEKVIDVIIPISAMRNDSRHFDEQPEWWMTLDD